MMSDDEGNAQWIPTGKTDNARRRLEVPEPLRTFLLHLAQGRLADSLLFGTHRPQPYGHPWLWKQVRDYCHLAGLKRLCPHSLRGLHSSLAVAAGCTASVVASALGHGSFAIAAKHYVDPAARQNSGVRRMTAALGGNAGTRPPPW